MADAVLQTMNDLLGMVPFVLNLPKNSLHLDYDNEADVLYINFSNPKHATDSEMTKEGILIRYRDDEIIGYTITDASKRSS